MIVVDASLAFSALVRNGPARRVLAQEQIHAPHLLDSELASVVRRWTTAGRLTAEQGWEVLAAWGQLGITRHSTFELLPRIWQLRDNVSAYDASYVSLAEALGCPLVTGDSRLARAPGPQCPITILHA